MKKHSTKNNYFLFCLLICCAAIYPFKTRAQNTAVNVSVSPTYEKLTVTIKSENDAACDHRINITNCEGKIIKSVSLNEKQLPKGADVYIHDIIIGNYCYSILNGSKEILHGEFITDIYDAL